MAVVFITGTVVKGGFNLGIDFAGGVKIIAKFEKEINEATIRKTIKKFNPMVQQIGEKQKNEYIISTKLTDTSVDKNVIDGKKQSGDNIAVKNESEQIKDILSKKYSKVQFLSVENVGPAIGEFLRKSAFKLFLIALVLMTIYLTFRFEFKYSVGAMAALTHDIFLSLAFCGIAGIEINIPVIAALLTIFGYSVNDTIVVFDRVRENAQVKSKLMFLDVINKSISQSLTRTLLTSLTTLFTVLALYMIGGEVLNEFAMVLLFGIFVGTYSSIYIASPILLGWEKMLTK